MHEDTERLEGLSYQEEEAQRCAYINPRSLFLRRKKMKCFVSVIGKYNNMNMQQQRQRKSASYRFMLPIINDAMLKQRAILNTEFKAVVEECCLPLPCIWMALMPFPSEDPIVSDRELARIRCVIDQIRGD